MVIYSEGAIGYLKNIVLFQFSTLFSLLIGYILGHVEDSVGSERLIWVYNFIYFCSFVDICESFC